MNKNELLISVFLMAEEGKLSDIEKQNITTALVSFGRSLNPKQIDEAFKNMRIGSRHLFEQIDSCLDTALITTKEYHKNIEKLIGKYDRLPKGAIISDDNDTIQFILSLDEKEMYNFSEAGKLIGISRQTIKSHADKGLFNLKITRKKKTDYISRENLIDYYRTYFNKDGFGF